MKPTKRKQRRGQSSRPQGNTPAIRNDDTSSGAGQSNSRRDLGVLISIWLALVLVMSLLARENLSVPGLYYDEAVFAGMAKDFLTGQVHGQHMPGYHVTELFGRPFPTFVQNYLGALKCWMLMPAFQLFGHTVAVLRASNLFWGFISLLFFMLGTWRWLGLRTALIAGAVLALDPTYVFLSILDWGVAGPSFLCRSIAFFLAAVWWQRRQAWSLFLAAFFAGLGFFNKIDFAVLLIAVTVAGFVCFGRPLWTALRTPISTVVFGAAGFLLGAGGMLFKLPIILSGTFSGTNPKAPGELTEKVNTMLALYDGSYFYRLMNVGGIFERMFAEPVNWLPIFGSTVLIAGVVCVVKRFPKDSGKTRAGLFFLVALILATLGVILLPGAVRIHHSVLIYPLPQLIVAFAANSFLERSTSARTQPIVVQVAIWVALLGLWFSQMGAIRRTQELVRDTGGRGRWSEAFDTFCRENKNRNDLTMVSLDWGFNEQLTFLTNGPKLSEPFWRFGQNPPPLPPDPNYLYLVHPEEYSLFPFSAYYLKQAEAKPAEMEVRPYFDRQNRPAFYTIQFLNRESR